MIEKEFRALLPAWTVCIAGLLASASGVELLNMLGAPIYFVGAASLGAMSIGHEYSHRTMGLLLSQPVARWRVLVTKLAVLAVMLAALLLVARGTVTVWRGTQFASAALWLPPLLALFVTPWLTMISRSALAGTVFTLSIVGVLLVAGEFIGVARYGYTKEVDAFRLALLWRTSIVFAVAGGWLAWRTLQRLEAIDGRGAEFHLAARARAANVNLTRRSAVWLMVRKELHLHQLAILVAAFYVVLASISFLLSGGPMRFDDARTMGTIYYCSLLAIVVGAQASAEERNLRTLESQLLAPMPAWRQWAIKAGVAIGLAIVLSIVVPTLVAWVFPPPGTPRFSYTPLLQRSTIVAILAFTCISLYVSSLCSSGLWALLMSVPAVGGTIAFLLMVAAPIAWRAAGGVTDRLRFSATGEAVMYYGLVATAAAVLLVLLRFAYLNHRSASRAGWQTAAQVGVLAASITVTMTAVFVTAALMR